MTQTKFKNPIGKRTWERMYMHNRHIRKTDKDRRNQMLRAFEVDEYFAYMQVKNGSINWEEALHIVNWNRQPNKTTMDFHKSLDPKNPDDAIYIEKRDMVLFPPREMDTFKDRDKAEKYWQELSEREGFIRWFKD